MDSLEHGMKALQLTPDSSQGLMAQLQQLMVQHGPLQQPPALSQDQQVLQQLGALLQQSPKAENKMLDNSEVLSSLTNLFKTPVTTSFRIPLNPALPKKLPFMLLLVVHMLLVAWTLLPANMLPTTSPF